MSLPVNIGAVVLAAGKGARLNCGDRPKVLCEIGGQPIVAYTAATLARLGFTPDRLVLVVGFQHEKVREHFSDRVGYAHQTEQLGTAHAAFTGMRALPPEVAEVLVMGGDDSAFYKAESLERLVAEHLRSGALVTVLTAEFDTPPLICRVIRDAAGNCVALREKEHLSAAEQKTIKEINTGTYCLNRAWFEKLFPTMQPLVGLGEYGLNTVVEVAVAAGSRVNAVKLENPQEWFGVNTPEELAEADRRKRMAN